MILAANRLSNSLSIDLLYCFVIINKLTQFGLHSLKRKETSNWNPQVTNIA